MDRTQVHGGVALEARGIKIVAAASKDWKTRGEPSTAAAHHGYCSPKDLKAQMRIRQDSSHGSEIA